MVSSRKFDIVLLGATGYTGGLVAEHIVKNFPTNLVWAIAGRSTESLKSVSARLSSLNPDRTSPELKVIELEDDDLNQLVQNTRVVINVIGPYRKLSSPILAACARNGTFYVDCTTETLWINEMIAKYETTAIESGAIIIPAISLSSSPSDLVAWLIATSIHEQAYKGTSEIVTSSKLELNGMSGGSLASVLDSRDAYGSSWFLWGDSWILSSKSASPSSLSWSTWLLGYRKAPQLGTLATSFVGPGNEAVVHRSYGLNPSLYGPNFIFREYVPASSVIAAVAIHALTWIGTVLLALAPFRFLVGGLAGPQGSGPALEDSRKVESVEFKAIGFVEGVEELRAMASFSYTGSTYEVSAILAAEAAGVLLERVNVSERDEQDLKGKGGILTPSSLGMSFVQRLRKAGVKIEVQKM